MRSITVDSNQREVTPHGTSAFPVEINQDDLSSFQDYHIRCHWHPELEISIVRSGQALYRLGSGTYALTGGQGLFINAKVPHMILSQSEEPAILTTFIIHPSFLYGTPESVIAAELFWPLQNSRRNAAIRLEPDTVRLFLRIDELNQARPFGYELQMKGLFCEAFFSLLSPWETELKHAAAIKESELETLDQILKILHETYAEPLNLGLLSEKVAMSKENCCRFFKRVTGQTLSAYLEDYRISQSLPLLAEGKLPIIQIAAQVGFSNAGRFSAAFVKRMQCTPRQYCRK